MPRRNHQRGRMYKRFLIFGRKFSEEGKMPRCGMMILYFRCTGINENGLYRQVITKKILLKVLVGFL